MSEQLYWVWLSQAFVAGSGKPNQILSDFDSPKDFYDNGLETAESLDYLSPSEVSKLRRTSLERAEFIIKECQRLGIGIVTQEDDDYPKRLAVLDSAPLVLYCKGVLEGLDEEPAIAVVGTRDSTEYGNRVTGNICYEFARAGAVVVSGCAVGIDSYAHLGALKAGGKTIAVLGCGLDVDYPRPHTELKEQILRKGGALVSELPPGTEPAPTIFPVRNRIITGLSLGVLVTEAPERSGALISVQHAIEQGKDVFCVPPNDIYDPKKTGVVKLIREGAQVVFCAKDVLYEYISEFPHKLELDKLLDNYATRTKTEPSAKAAETAEIPKQSESTEVAAAPKPEEPEEDISQKPATPINLSPVQKKVFESLEYLPRPVDDIAAAAGMEVKDVLAALTELEISGLVFSMSGSRYGLLHK